MAAFCFTSARINAASFGFDGSGSRSEPTLPEK